MTLTLKYRAGSKPGLMAPSWRFGRFETRAAAEACRHECATADEDIEIVPVDDESPVTQGETGTIGAQVKTAPAVRQHCDSGASPNDGGSTDGS